MEGGVALTKVVVVGGGEVDVRVVGDRRGLWEGSVDDYLMTSTGQSLEHPLVEVMM